ncbi:MAG: hypothetical protein CMD46_01515 [Gammaproteobacteria bacterium]|nr:hypothetical protein [Gammaproteobacteria bacterium]|tara:strand:- start:3903 stop:5453 length:1551 start_codon:yes stop_codon:yes gene_type:complete
MSKIFKTLFLLIFIFTSKVVHSNPSFIIEDTEIIGMSSEDNVDVYLGVPYAEAPIGDLRWSKTKTKVFKEDKYYADKFASACMQGPRIVNWYRGVAEGFGGDPNYIDMPEVSEDCLYLNMWVPKGDNKNNKMPVLLYIHGGSNRAGWSFEPNYIGKKLSQNGVIVISVSYRLGIFGFYTHPELKVSNFALYDLIESLKWIQENISKVGGDPNNVTISGESAGATNVAHLIVSPLGKNLFQRAIHQSAGWSIAEIDIIEGDDHKKLSNKLSISLVNTDNNSNNIKELKKIDAIKLLNEAEKIYGYTGYYPVVDGYSIIEPIYESFKQGNFNHVDLIIGTNADEELMYLDKDYYLSDFYDERESWGFYSDSDDIGVLVKDIKDEKQKLNYLLTARNWTCPSMFIASAITKYSNKSAWFYSFERVRDGDKSKEMGAYHGAEIPYIFNTHDKWLPTNRIDDLLTIKIQKHWVNFLNSGNPNNSYQIWRKFDSEKFNVYSYDRYSKMKISDATPVCKHLGY